MHGAGSINQLLPGVLLLTVGFLMFSGGIEKGTSVSNRLNHFRPTIFSITPENTKKLLFFKCFSSY